MKKHGHEACHVDIPGGRLRGGLGHPHRQLTRMVRVVGEIVQTHVLDPHVADRLAISSNQMREQALVVHATGCLEDATSTQGPVVGRPGGVLPLVCNVFDQGVRVHQEPGPQALHFFVAQALTVVWVSGRQGLPAALQVLAVAEVVVGYPTVCDKDGLTAIVGFRPRVVAVGIRDALDHGILGDRDLPRNRENAGGEPEVSPGAAHLAGDRATTGACAAFDKLNPLLAVLGFLELLKQVHGTLARAALVILGQCSILGALRANKQGS
mmetsp:Transcript_92149/g.127930  ORF Transcript_92149/g.127930 Transcript_92149/m.127930 type:complete len:267 (+) Transcript_92149:556-1356(+)